MLVLDFLIWIWQTWLTGGEFDWQVFLPGELGPLLWCARPEQLHYEPQPEKINDVSSITKVRGQFITILSQQVQQILIYHSLQQYVQIFSLI